MHAIRQYEFGPAENLRYEEVEDPAPAAGQVRIAVEAAGVHLLDTSIRKGEAFGTGPRPGLPMTPGREVAGRVEAVGEGVEATGSASASSSTSAPAAAAATRNEPLPMSPPCTSCPRS